MKTKKNRDYDLERLRTPLTFLGLLFASAVALSMLEWRVPDERPEKKPYERPIILTDEVVQIAIPEKKPKEVKKQTKQEVIDKILLIDDGGDDNVLLDFPDLADPVPIEIEKEPEIVDETPVIAPDVMPEFPGGYAAMRAYLKSELHYPAMARSATIQGKVWIEFIVNKQGEISDVKVVRGIGGGCDEEALRVVLQMPQWKPGKQHGRPVNVLYHLPVAFILQN